MGLNKQVTFPTAKLLKEKGFDINCVNCYAEERLINKKTGGDLFTGVYRLCTKSRFHKRYYSAPNIAEVVMWLYEKHGIWISIEPPFPKRIVLWEYYIQKSEDRTLLGQNSGYDSPTKAYEAGIEYALKNLIP